VAASSALVACGGGGAKAGHGGKLTMLAAGDVDSLDPGQTYFATGYMVQYAVNRPLYSYRPRDAAHPVPDLAAGPPEVSPDNRTITVHLKRGVKYAPPVGREVTARDVKYAFERAFSKHVPSGYASTYFSSIVGAPASPGEIKPIEGIQTPDDHTIVFRLSAPTAALMSKALVMPITVPIPEEYAAKYDRDTPSTYDQHVAFTGPYMVRNDRKTGKLTGRVPGRSIDIVRNPNWDRSTDYRPAYVDAIHVQEGNALTVAARQALSGSATVCCDAPQPPLAVLKQAFQRHRNQVRFVSAGATAYISLNTAVKPLDNVAIRRAIIAASDRDALRLTVGGKIAGEVASGWIPPGVPGFREAGGLSQNTDLDFLRNPGGDLDVARKYMLAAKNEDPSLPIDGDGRWTGSQELLTVAGNTDPAKQTAVAFQSQIGRLGFKIKLRLLSPETMFTKFLQVPAQKVAFGPTAAWFRDFGDAQASLDAPFNGRNIRPVGNVNFSQLDVPAINQAMTAASQVPVGPGRDRAWARVNHMIAEAAPAIPYLWPTDAMVHSRDVAGALSSYEGIADLSFTSIKR
jgi:peptide/nickel transport system substrate-binding protein